MAIVGELREVALCLQAPILADELCLADEERAGDGERGSREGMLGVHSGRPISKIYEKLVTVI